MIEYGENKVEKYILNERRKNRHTNIKDTTDEFQFVHVINTTFTKKKMMGNDLTFKRQSCIQKKRTQKFCRIFVRKRTTYA